MSVLSRFVPTARLRQVDHVVVRATPEQAYEAFRHLDVTQFGFVRALFWLREAPERLAGTRHDPVRVGIDTVADGSSEGFVMLADVRGRGVAVGSVGRFWRPDMEFAEVAPDAFESFAEPGWGKLAWSLWAEPGPGGGAVITFELRITATDDATWTSFARYFRLIGPFSHAIRRAVLRHLSRRLGEVARPDVEDLALPGDELLPQVQNQITYAIDIDAPPALVWPYLVQMGRWRAGWYSYDTLDNDGRPSADRVVPELQALAVGDLVPTGPGPRDGYRVQRIDPERALVLAAEARSLQVTWAFVLEPVGEDACRLVTRVRGLSTDRATELTYVRLLAPVVHAIMERRQLRGIRDRAERDVVTSG